MTQLWPSLITGAVALLSTLLSFIIASMTIRRARQESGDSRSHQIAVSLLPRRLEAYSDAWRILLSIQDGAAMPSADRENVLASTLWMSDKARAAVLRVLSGDHPAREVVRAAQKELLDDIAVRSIDVTLSRMSI